MEVEGLDAEDPFEELDLVLIDQLLYPVVGHGVQMVLQLLVSFGLGLLEVLDLPL